VLHHRAPERPGVRDHDPDLHAAQDKDRVSLRRFLGYDAGTATGGCGVHGIIFSSLADYLRARGLADEVPAQYELDRAYPDRELVALLERAAVRTSTTVDETLRDFGRFLGRDAFPKLAPAFYVQHQSLTAALLAVEEEIHERLRAVFPGALPPRLRVSPLGEHGAVIAYTSERRLCGLLEGLVEGTAERYATRVRIEQPQCMHRGEPACSVVVEVI
jgi:predicted hydrocarbon binding protein